MVDGHWTCPLLAVKLSEQSAEPVGARRALTPNGFIGKRDSSKLKQRSAPQELFIHLGWFFGGPTPTPGAITTASSAAPARTPAGTDRLRCGIVTASAGSAKESTPTSMPHSTS